MIARPKILYKAPEASAHSTMSYSDPRPKLTQWSYKSPCTLLEASHPITLTLKFTLPSCKCQDPPWMQMVMPRGAETQCSLLQEDCSCRFIAPCANYGGILQMEGTPYLKHSKFALGPSWKFSRVRAGLPDLSLTRKCKGSDSGIS